MILSIHEDTNANVTLMNNSGTILAAAAKERFSRIKFDCGYPSELIEHILSAYNLTLNDITLCVSANRLHVPARILGESFPSFDHKFFGRTQKLYLLFHALLARFPKLAIPVYYFNKTATELRMKKKCTLIDHHTAHAYSAYITSGFEKALAVSIDNIGDGYSAKVFSCANGICSFIKGDDTLSSAGQFYGEIAELIGISAIQAGKMTGMAGFGDYRTCHSFFESVFQSKNGRFIFTPHSKKAYYSSLKNFKKRDIAAGAQHQLEKAIVEYVIHAVRETGIKKIVLAGGVFANVRVNQLLWEHPEIDDIFIHPAMTDQGISLGAAYAALAKHRELKPQPLNNPYLGFEYSDTEIEKTLKKHNIIYSYPGSNVFEQTAQLIHSGKIVARYQGRMEYGPRALGNRSILMRATENRSLELNKKLKRAVYMPFAPVTLAEYADKCYENIHPVNARFMTMSFNTKKFMQQCPMVVHRDFTARPQIVSETDNPGYYSILRHYYELSGIPSIVNTSFNNHGEPIVESPDDAVSSFIKSGLDCLSIGGFIVLKEEQNKTLK